MKKLITSFLLFLIVFLSGGYSFLYAHVHAKPAGYPSVPSLQSYYNNNSNPGQLRESSWFGLEKVKLKKFIAESEDDEEEDSSTLKKSSDNAKYFPAGFLTFFSGFLFRVSTKLLPYGHHFAPFSATRLFLLFLVIRV